MYLQENKPIIMGNARVGQNGGMWKGVIGEHEVGKEKSNETLLLRECAKHDLAIQSFLASSKEEDDVDASKIEIMAPH